MHQQQVHSEEAPGALLRGPLRRDHHLRGPALPPHRHLPARRRPRARPRRRPRRPDGVLCAPPLQQPAGDAQYSPNPSSSGAGPPRLYAGDVVVVAPAAAALQPGAAGDKQLPVVDDDDDVVDFCFHAVIVAG